MKTYNLVMAPEGEENAGGGAPKQPDLQKVIDEKFGSLSKTLEQLNQKLSANTEKQSAPKKQQVEEDDLDTLILADPRKAVERITSKVKEDVFNTVRQENTQKDSFAVKFSELQNEYPEIADMSSDLYKRAKEIMQESQTGAYDSSALERSVLRAASEKGVLPMQHRRKQQQSDGEESDGGYIGGGNGFSENRPNRRKSSDKLPAATLAFAELVGMNIKDPKVVERLTKTYNDRRGNWNKYK